MSFQSTKTMVSEFSMNAFLKDQSFISVFGDRLIHPSSQKTILFLNLIQCMKNKKRNQRKHLCCQRAPHLGN